MTDERTPSSARAAGLVTVQLGTDLKRTWAQWCVDRHLIPGKALRSLVEQALAQDPNLSPTPLQQPVRVAVATQPDRGAKVGREIQFTPSENAAIEAVAQAQGFGFQEWVVAAVRAALAKAPGHGQPEMETLTQSNAHLAQVVSDLAVLRRQGGVGASAEALTRLEGDLRQHVETVSAAMAQGAQRWQLTIRK